jgi:hypothetical protein
VYKKYSATKIAQSSSIKTTPFFTLNVKYNGAEKSMLHTTGRNKNNHK